MFHFIVRLTRVMIPLNPNKTPINYQFTMSSIHGICAYVFPTKVLLTIMRIYKYSGQLQNEVVYRMHYNMSCIHVAGALPCSVCLCRHTVSKKVHPYPVSPATNNVKTILHHKKSFNQISQNMKT
jgi:hypothetical protein